MYNPKSSPSAKVLANEIRAQTLGLLVKRGTVKSKHLKRRVFDYVINVGNSMKYGFDNTTEIINLPNRIARSANKKLARMRFKAQKISAPTLWLSPKDIPAAEFPVVGRTTYHMKARGFWYCKKPADAVQAKKAGATHFIKFIKNTREFRAHVFATSLKPKSWEDYVIVRLVEKRQTVSTKTAIIKNHENGYRFVKPAKTSQGVLEAVRHLAKETIHKFGLHYGGVDIVFSQDTNKAYVLEINTTPCLTDETSSTLDIYTSHFIDLIGAKRQSNDGDHF